MCSKRRTILWTATTLVSLVAIALLCCLEPVDNQPYFRSAYYAETMARVDATIATNQVARGLLLAGFGRARLTPPAEIGPVPLAGYGDRKGRPASGVHDDIYVKALALRVGNRTGVLVGADALIIPREVADLASERLQTIAGLAREQLYLGATHTHCSLGGWGEGFVGEAFAGEYNPRVRSWFAECIVAAVTNALEDVKPAAFGHGNFPAPEFIRNRLVGNLGRVDPEFAYLLVRQEEGATAVLGSFSAHATVLSSKMMEFSGDYPGAWQRAVEDAGISMALFMAGGVGSHSAVAGAPAMEGVERLGSALAKRVVEQLPSTPLTNSIAFGLVGSAVSLPEFHVRVSDSIRLRPWLARILLCAKQPSFMQAFRIDDFIAVSAPCDFSGELALDIKDSLRARGFQAAVTSFNGDYVGYVIPSRYYHMNGYEPRLMSFYGPTVPDYFQELIRTMTVHLAAN